MRLNVLTRPISNNKEFSAYTNNEGPDLTAHMRSLIWAIVVCLEKDWKLLTLLAESGDPDQPSCMVIWVFAIRILVSPFLCLVRFKLPYITVSILIDLNKQCRPRSDAYTVCYSSNNRPLSHCCAHAPNCPGKSRIGVISARLQSRGQVSIRCISE